MTTDDELPAGIRIWKDPASLRPWAWWLPLGGMALLALIGLVLILLGAAESGGDALLAALLGTTTLALLAAARRAWRWHLERRR